MADVGKAYVQIVPSGNGIKDELQKLLGDPSDGAGKSAGKKAGASLLSGLASVVKAAAVGKIIKDAFNAGSDLEQNLGGTEAVFGSFADSVQKTAVDAYKNMGLSASDYMATANKMGSLFQGSGLDQARALDLTTQAMQRAADVASVMGIDTTMAMESIAGAAKGNFTMMDNLGVAMNATTLEAYALEKGVNFKWNTASNAEKAELAMQMFFDRTSQYAGNFEREVNGTVAGSLSALKSSWQNLLGALTTGWNLDNALAGLAKSAMAFARNAIGMGKNVAVALGRGLLQGVPYLMQNTTTLLNNFTGQLTANLPALVTKGGEFLMSVVHGIRTNLPALITAAGTAVTTLLNGLSAALPTLLTTGMALLQALLQGIIASIPSLLTAAATIIANFATGLATNFPTILKSGIELIGQLVAGVISAIGTFISTVPELYNKFATAFGEVDWAQLGANLIEGIRNGIVAAAHRIAEAARAAARAALDAAKDESDTHSPSRKWDRELGRWWPAGIAQGFEHAMPDAEREIRASMNSAVMSARADLQSMSAPAQNLTANDMRAAMSGVQMAAPVVKIIGDTSRIFKVVKDANEVRTRATGYNALARG
ncbi:MAG: hypothetical protein MJY89_07630 [Bacteroidales bacterium]|nr:hypothetical protein [Bacteroidales bacterium]